MMQGYRNFPGRYDVIPDKGERRKLWQGVFHGRRVICSGQALIPMLEPKIIGLVMDRVLAALDEGDEP